MKNATPLPIDPFGNPIPVFVPDTKKTQTLAIADATTFATQTIPFSKTAESLATTGELDICSGDDTITFTSKIRGIESEQITITITADGAAAAVSVSGKDITFVGMNKEPKCSAIKALCEANPAVDALITVSYKNADATMDAAAALAKTYLQGWDDGNTPTVVRLTASNDCFIGTFSEALTTTKTASMPLWAKTYVDICVMPGQLITAVGVATVTGAKVYLTPAKKF
ncbi:MAG TPA: hypothetical protein PKI15_01775 [Candidatus Cloacimonadota bacterium]|nr:hypothetical protein [Candidatus Cloacimonadota bacterium]